jgi:hypothetical protein
MERHVAERQRLALAALSRSGSVGLCIAFSHPFIKNFLLFSCVSA